MNDYESVYTWSERMEDKRTAESEVDMSRIIQGQNCMEKNLHESSCWIVVGDSILDTDVLWFLESYFVAQIMWQNRLMFYDLMEHGIPLKVLDISSTT